MENSVQNFALGIIVAAIGFLLLRKHSEKPVMMREESAPAQASISSVSSESSCGCSGKSANTGSTSSTPLTIGGQSYSRTGYSQATVTP